MYATVLSSIEIGCDAPEGLADGRVSLSVAFGTSKRYCDAGLRYEYAPAPTVTEVTPSQGVARGDILRVTGQNFRENCVCRVGAAPPSPALRLSSTLIECAVPSSLQRGTHTLRAANNGLDFGDGTTVETRGDPIQLTLRPRLGPATGNTKLEVMKVELLGDQNLTCVIAGRSTPLIHGTCASPAIFHRRSGSFDTLRHWFQSGRSVFVLLPRPLRAASVEPATGSVAGGTRRGVVVSDAPSVIEAHGGAYACAFGDSASIKG